MQRTSRPLIGLAICLAALAGFVDAIAWTSLGGFFASFMSGNTTRLGVGLANRGLGDAQLGGALVLSFVSGVMLATVLGYRFPARQGSAVLALVTVLLATAAALAHFTYLPLQLVLLLLAAAMGAENGVFARHGEVSIGLTYMTGTLVKFGQRLTAALLGASGRWEWVPHLLLWTGFAAGVFAGARWQALLGLDAVWIAVAASAMLTSSAMLIEGAGRRARVTRELGSRDATPR